MNRYPHTTAGSIVLLGSAIMFTGAVFATGGNGEVVLFTMAVLFGAGGLLLMWSREKPEK